MTHVMQEPQDRGFVLLFALFTITVGLGLSVVGLTRSMNDLSIAQRNADFSQTFHIAEATLDEGLAKLRASLPSDVNALLRNLPANLPCTFKDQSGVTNCGLRVEDDADEAFGNDPSKDTNGIVTLLATGIQHGLTQRIRATIHVDTSAPVVYPYAVAGKTINMDGNATFGEPLHPEDTLIYSEGPPDSTGSFATSGTNNVWASRIAFYNPTGLPLTTLCPNCGDLSTFHGPPLFDLAAPRAPELTMDLKPFYDEAVTEGHVITADTTFQNKTLSGVYYVECGVNVTIRGAVTLNGTLVHEGCLGNLEVAQQASLTIDSTAGPNPFASGMAIIGVPDLGFGRNTTVDLRGLVMGSGSRSTIMSKNGLIRGSLLAVGDAWLDYPQLASGPGPGPNSLITFPLDRLHIGEAKVIFTAILRNNPGPTIGGVKVELKAWILERN